MAQLTVKNLIYEITGRRVIDSVSLAAESGELIAVLGKSGCGKTTLLKCLAGLLKPSNGSIMVGDTDIAALDHHQSDAMRLRIGLVFQYAALFDSLSVYENVSFGLRYHRRLTEQAMREAVAQRLAEVGMEGTEKLMPSELSGGMRKRVGLARALVLEPEVLLYDEPTSGLDPVIARTIDDLIVSTCQRRRVTSVVVTHDVGAAMRIASHIVLMEKGKVVLEASPAELRSSTNATVREFMDAVA